MNTSFDIVYMDILILYILILYIISGKFIIGIGRNLVGYLNSQAIRSITTFLSIV